MDVAAVAAVAGQYLPSAFLVHRLITPTACPACPSCPSLSCGSLTCAGSAVSGQPGGAALPSWAVILFVVSLGTVLGAGLALALVWRLSAAAAPESWCRRRQGPADAAPQASPASTGLQDGPDGGSERLSGPAGGLITPAGGLTGGGLFVSPATRRHGAGVGRA